MTLTATIEEPLQGAWVADVVTLRMVSDSFELGGVAWFGSTVSAFVDGGRWRARIVGGRGKLGIKLSNRQYRGSVRIDKIASDIIQAAGETVGNVTSSVRFENYERGELSAGKCLDNLASLSNHTWYVDRDGNTHFTEARTIRTVTGIVHARDTNSVTLNVKTADINPGDFYDGRRIEHLRWILSSDKLLAELSFTNPFAMGTDRNAWYLRTYAAKVDKQNLDGTVDLIVDGKFTANLVPLVGPVEANMQPGDLVTFGYFRGDPRSPYAVPATSTKRIDMGALIYIPGTPGSLSWVPPITRDNPIPAPQTVLPSPPGTPIYGVIS
jgi:hypothetical protein